MLVTERWFYDIDVQISRSDGALLFAIIEWFIFVKVEVLYEQQRARLCGYKNRNAESTSPELIYADAINLKWIKIRVDCIHSCAANKTGNGSLQVSTASVQSKNGSSHQKTVVNSPAASVRDTKTYGSQKHCAQINIWHSVE